MKVALCLSGLSSGLNHKHGGLPVSFKSEASNYKKYFIDENNADVFFHSWANAHEREIIDIYNPVRYLFEEKKTFKKPTIYNFIYNIYGFVFGHKNTTELYRLNNIYSRWYSLYKSISLLNDYQVENGIEYDFILLSRFDLTLLSLFDCSELDPDDFYIGNWLGFKNSAGLIIQEEDVAKEKSLISFPRGYPKNNAVLDFWFLSSSENIIKFSKLFLDIEVLIKEFGPNNHILAYEYINKKKIGKILSLYKRQFYDFNLTRWL